MHISGSRARACAAMAAVAPLLALATAAPSQATAPGPLDRVVVPGTQPAWAQPGADEGAASPSAPVSARVYLAGRDRAGLEREALAVSDPNSRSYGKFLTARQLQERYGAGADQVAAVKAWLTAGGLEVSAGGNDHYLAVRGTVAQAEKTFATKLHSYRRDGHSYQAPNSEISVPASVAPAVLSVYGLNNAPSRVHHGAQEHRATAPATAIPQDTLPGPAPAFVNSGPFSTFYGSDPATGTPQAYGATQPYVIKGYDGRQLRSAYGAAGTGLTGQGVTVAVVDAYDSPTIVDDVTRYAAAHGDAPYSEGQLTRVDPAGWTNTADPSVDPNGCGASGWYGEQTLDIEAVHAVAPEAGITYVGATSCNDPDLLDALTRIVDNRLADIVSNSWGEAENRSDPALDSVYNRTFLLGALEGIGFYFSSGDDGDDVASTGTKQTDMPASLPYVTAVGGTSLGLGGDGGYAFETGWGTEKAVLSADGGSWTDFPGAFTSGAGGGTSARVNQPSYQRHIVPDALARANGGSRGRVVPDIAAVADPNTGFLVGQTQAFPDGTVKYGEYRLGGTSLASPVIAGIQALAQQAKGHPLGFANPAIYQRFGTSAFHDVTDHPNPPGTELAEVRVDFKNAVDDTDGTVTSIRSLGKDSSLSATVGYDDVTGVGSPTEDYLASYRSR